MQAKSFRRAGILSVSIAGLMNVDEYRRTGARHERGFVLVGLKGQNGG